MTGKHQQHLSRDLACDNCHENYINDKNHRNGILDSSTPAIIVRFDSFNPSGAWNNTTGDCSNLSCHGEGSPGINWYADFSGNCAACHSPGSSIDPLITSGSGASGKHAAHVTDKNIDCNICHYNYKEKFSHMNKIYGRAESGSIVNFSGVYPATGGSPVTAAYNDSTGECGNVSCLGGTGGVTWYETSTLCTACHAPGSALDPLTINGSGASGKHVKHVADIGISCEKCHYNYKNNASHMNGAVNTHDLSTIIVYFDSTNPSPGAWDNSTTGNCSSLKCHATTFQWYVDYIPPSLPDCISNCHISAIADRRQVTGAGGDFDKESHHVIDYAARTTIKIVQEDCKVCHDMSKHMSGSVRLKDKDNGSNIITYNPSSPSSLETFCLSCHDSLGATTESVPLKPFNALDPNTLGTAANKAGTEIKGYWNKAYGHGKKGITCMGDGFTGCHGNYNTVTKIGTVNAHGSGNRGLLSNNMTFPIPSEVINESRYKLCLDCHKQDKYNSLGILSIQELMGVAEGGNYAQPRLNYTTWPYIVDFMVTGFRDYYSYGFDRQYNLHLYHVNGAGLSYQYRGSGASKPTCVSCHNVHGVDNPLFFIWDEWNFTIEVDPVSGIEYGKISESQFPVTQYPEYCSNQCHKGGHIPFMGDDKYPRSPFNEAKAVASDASGGGSGIQNGDTVTIYFSNSTTTNGVVIDSSNINTVLAINNTHKWMDTVSGGSIDAQWLSADGKSNNVLKITITNIAGSTIAKDDTITFDLTTIKDTTAAANPIRGKMTLKGDF